MLSDWSRLIGEIFFFRFAFDFWRRFIIFWKTSLAIQNPIQIHIRKNIQNFKDKIKARFVPPRKEVGQTRTLYPNFIGKCGSIQTVIIQYDFKTFDKFFSVYHCKLQLKIDDLQM